jgi:tetratricopeptide (TPR) repeat protein
LSSINVNFQDRRIRRSEIENGAPINSASCPNLGILLVTVGSEAIDKKSLRDLFGKVLDLPPSQREDYLNRVEAPEEVRAELRELLAAEAGAHTFLSSIVGNPVRASMGLDERFGSFITREQIGSGGMGAVFRAERIDGEISQTVAIKILDRAFGQQSSVVRFARERQILARLEHPNIARLLDGGTRADGVAYLVMELVDGIPVDRFCEERSLSIEEKLKLFLPLCQAVDYAHQQLIVHRDLKPSNVLVTQSGVPKLLDFGIAKALDAPAAATQTIALTPEFGSPEQIRGEEATTRTDVYGLGAVLYFLLTKRPPHRFKNLSTEELRRAICDEAPETPSAIRPDLKGDLENVLLKALHADPARRYASARDFAEDLERYLTHRPVLATPDSVSYRVSRFVRRHRLACAGGLIGFLAVAAGVAGSLYEAHRAEQRFAQVRELANRFVFDFEASIRDTPGTLAARRMVAATARQYLASLSAEAGRDAGLNRELAESYYRLSRVEFRAGESKESIEHLRTALAILKRLKDDCCGPPESRANYISWTTVLARAQEESRSREEASKLSADALENARQWAKHAPVDGVGGKAFGKAMIDALSTSGNILADAGKAAQSRDVLEEAVQYCDRLLPSSQDDELGFACVRAHQWLAGSLASLGEDGQALDALREADQILGGLLAHHPTNIVWRAQRAQIATGTAVAYRKLSQKDPSLKPKVEEAARQAYTIAVANARENPDDRALLDSALVMTGRLANQLFRDDRKAESIPLFLEARDIADRLVASDPLNRRNLYLQMNNRLVLGGMYSNMNDWQTGVKYSLEAERLVDEILRISPSDLTSQDSKVTILMNLAIAYRHLGKLDDAREQCREALQLASRLLSENREAKNPVGYLDDLREQARILGVPDPTK